MDPQITAAIIVLSSSLSTAILMFIFETKRTEKTRLLQEIDQKRKERIDILFHRYNQVELCADKVINAIYTTREKFVLAGREAVKGKKVDTDALTSFLDHIMLFDEIGQFWVVVHAIDDGNLINYHKDLNEIFSTLIGWTQAQLTDLGQDQHPYNKGALEEDIDTINNLVGRCLDIYSLIYQRLDKLKHETWLFYASS